MLSITTNKEPFNVKTNDVDGEKPRPAVLPKKTWHLAGPYSFVACSPVSSCLTCLPVHVELAQTQSATELLHVFGTFWGISVKRLTILKCVSVLYASTVPRPSSGAVMFGFRRHVWFSRQPPDSLQQRDACKRNQSAALPQSFLLFAEGAEGGSHRNQSGLRQHCCCCCMVKHRGAPTVRYSLYMFTQGQIKIIWASPEGERKCAVWSPGCNNQSFVDHDGSTLLSHSNQESWA